MGHRLTAGVIPSKEGGLIYAQGFSASIRVLGDPREIRAMSKRHHGLLSFTLMSIAWSVQAATPHLTDFRQLYDGTMDSTGPVTANRRPIEFRTIESIASAVAKPAAHNDQASRMAAN